MLFFRRMCRTIALPLATVIVVISAPLGLVRAGMVTTEEAIDATDAAVDRDTVLRFLAREDVRGHVQSLGVDPGEAAARVASLSDRQIQDIAGRIDELPAGQGAAGAIVGAALVIFIALLITDVLGYTDIFPFVKHQPAG